MGRGRGAPHRWTARCGLALGLVFATACEEPPPPDARQPDTPPVVIAPPAPPSLFHCPTDSPLDPGPGVVRSLNRREYTRAVTDLFGQPPRPDRPLAPDNVALGFDNNARALQVSPLLAEQWMDAAETLAAELRPRLAELTLCDPASEPPRACAEAFIRVHGRRVWRRPLHDAEVERLLSLYDLGALLDGDVHAEGLTMVVEALLQSPHFLYRVEVGEPGADDAAPRALNDHELATRLSFLLWGTTPDDALLDAADARTLRTEDGLSAQVERLLLDPRARDAVEDFFGQWLEVERLETLERDPLVHPEFSPTSRAHFAEETRLFIEHVVFSPGASLRTLFDADFSFLNGPLAAFYGVAGVEGDAFVLTPLDTKTRRGILTHASVLAAHSRPNSTAPVHRGLFVRDRLLCTPLPSPPAALAVVAPEPDPSATTREQWRQHSDDPACSGCHTLIDPIGFAFEHYDAVGRWRTHEHGFEIDASGALNGTFGLDGPFYGVPELAARLADAEQVQQCVTRQVFRFAFGRGEEPADACTLATLHEAYATEDHNLLALLRAVTRSPAFSLRRAPTPLPDELLP